MNSWRQARLEYVGDRKYIFHLLYEFGKGDLNTCLLNINNQNRQKQLQHWTTKDFIMV